MGGFGSFGNTSEIFSAKFLMDITNVLKNIEKALVDIREEIKASRLKQSK